ncbi:hypothetical protein [Egicoccus halophilus]|uniref:Uncharacterized protein n=1 Tax=Egicoccus halophilus TaxID=1670830 RepID=A0A8J3ETF6_9ACTN|nr:hypothetical protein [Egicoccus halophilus]GGI05108.1 hypothetical protein GCM10011354_12450 [Egicoccus halophilus]
MAATSNTAKKTAKKTARKKTAAKRTAAAPAATTPVEAAPVEAAPVEATTPADTPTPTEEAAPIEESTPTDEPTLDEREATSVLEDAGYAAAGLAHDVVTLARRLPERLESVKVDEWRERVGKDVEGLLGQLTELLDKKATEGRRVAADVRSDARVARLLEQTGATRSQVRAAVSSVRRTADVTVAAGRFAGRRQAEVATNQVRTAATSVRRSGATVADTAADVATDEVTQD